MPNVTAYLSRQEYATLQASKLSASKLLQQALYEATGDEVVPLEKRRCYVCGEEITGRRSGARVCDEVFCEKIILPRARSRAAKVGQPFFTRQGIGLEFIAYELYRLVADGKCLGEVLDEFEQGRN